ncbi:MAG: hypothetical protein NVSMB25_06680 [Thermoleophilaceae bacterium]
MRARLASQSGWAVVTAVMVMSLMMSGGLATYAYVDDQTQQSAVERARESALNLAEAALNEQVLILGRTWPTAAAPFPASCSQSSTDPNCPDPNGAWRNGYNTQDYASGTSWSTQVMDNAGAISSYYSDAAAAGQTNNTYDAQPDGILWVRAQAVVRGQTRALVTQVKRTQRDLSADFPHNVITAGSFSTSNQGNKVLVATGGSPLVVRCKDPNDPNCLSYAKNKGQVSPDTTSTGYTGGNALPAADIASLRAAAQAAGTYYASGCPADISGLVFIENAGGQCSYQGTTYNSPTKPGVVIVANGSLYFGSLVTYYGVVYMVNGQNSSGTVFETHANATMYGSVAVDGPGHVTVGSAHAPVTYDSNAFAALQGVGTALAVQNTWRELLKH